VAVQFREVLAGKAAGSGKNRTKRAVYNRACCGVADLAETQGVRPRYRRSRRSPEPIGDQYRLRAGKPDYRDGATADGGGGRDDSIGDVHRLKIYHRRRTLRSTIG